jgi:YD repeat-containing protein
MNIISVKKIKKGLFLLVVLVAIKNSKGQNNNSIILTAPESSTELHTACQYIDLLPGYQYTATNNNHMLSNIDNANMCDVTYISDAGFEDNNPPPLNTNLAVGTINGTFDVDPNGASNYSIPLTVPPGTMGMVPQLSINYSSQGGNGILGNGFSLSGLSSITRTTQTIYHDAQIYPVTLTNNDRFLLDGTRLILPPSEATSAYGAYGTTIYHTEIESFKLVTSYASSNNGPDYFTVLDKDGTMYEYGYTSDSKVLASGNHNIVLTWLLDKVTNNRGNYMTFEYFNDNNGNFYPISIQYTGNQNSSPIITPYNKVTFSYALRGDPQTDYIAGSQTNQNVLLTGVQMYAQNTLVHHYELDYSKDQLYSHLVQIIEYGSDGSSYNPTKFNWHNNLSQSQAVTQNYFTSMADVGYFTGGRGYFTNPPSPPTLLCGDFNGNGLTNVVVLQVFNPLYSFNANINYTLYLEGLDPNNNNTYTPSLQGQINYPNGYLGNYYTLSEDVGGGEPSYSPRYGFPTTVPPLDFNGDGKDDLVLYSPVYNPNNLETTDYFSVFLSNGVSFNSSPNYTFKGLNPSAIDGEASMFPQIFQTAVGDFDGDGIPDLLVYYPQWDKIYLYSIKNGTPVIDTFHLGDNNNSWFWPNDRGNSFSEQNDVFAIDINGDGRKEVFLTAINHAYIFNLNADGSTTLISNTIVFGPVIDGTTYPDLASVYQGDFNGDGKTDILFYNNGGSELNNWKIGYSNGKDGFTITSASNIVHENGSAYGCMKNQASFPPHNYYVADFNGDGIDDIVDESFTQINGGWDTLGTYSWYTYNAINLDVYFFTGNTQEVLNNTGGFVHKNYNESLSNSIGPENPTYVADFNGDGHVDLAYWGNGREPDRLFTFDLNTQPDNGINKVIGIANGLNATTKIQYGNLPNMALLPTNNDLPYPYSQGSNATFPLEDIQWPLYVTEFTAEDNGNGSENYVGYTYYGGLNNEQGKGFLGFSNQSIYNFVLGNGISNSYEFNNGFYDQLPLSTSTTSFTAGYLVDNKTFNYTTINNPTNITSGSKIHYNYLNQETDNNDLYGLSNTVTYQEDIYGNTVKEVGNNSAVTYTTVCTYVTEPNIGWSGQLPACMATFTSTTTKTNPSETPYTRWMNYTYNSYGQPLTETQDIGLIITNTYDDLGANVGNLISTAVSGGVPARTYSYQYDYPYRRFVTTETNPLGQSSSASYDNAYGNQLSTTDPNGLVSHYSYDGFGRMQQEILPTGEQVTATRAWDNISGLPYSLFYAQVSAPGETTVTNYYDKLGKILRTQRNGFNGTNINKDMTYYNNQLIE